jgi:RHS repeat-associated protein
VVRYTYDSWGNHDITVLDSSCGHLANINPFRYRGYYYDTETDLYYLKTRYYDPEIGRFISIDGISYLNPNAINGLNLYAYCYNNPVYYIDKTGTSPELSTEVDVWSLYNFKNYIWRSGRYQPRCTYKISNNPFKYLGNNLLFAGELLLSKFELNFGGYEFTALNFNTGFTILSAGFDLLDGRVYFSDTDYLGIKVGSVNLDIIDIQPMENNYTIVDAQATALTVGAYSEYVDAELLVGSVGATLKCKDGKFTFGVSWGIGFKITIKFW